MSDTFVDANQIVRLGGTLVETGTQTFENIAATGTITAGTTITATGELTGADVSVIGLTGAVTPIRIAGGTATVAPTTGTFAVGDVAVSVNGSAWVCTVAGTPGTWVGLGSVLLAPKASPTFTGTPAAPTAAADTNTTQLATTAYVIAQAYAKLAGPTFTGTVTVPAAAAATSATKLSDLSSALTITSGTLPNLGAWASGTAKVNPVTRQISVGVEVVTAGTATTATCVIAISPDNSTFTTVATPGASTAINTVGGITLGSWVTLPAGWYIKLTFANCTVAASIYY